MKRFAYLFLLTIIVGAGCAAQKLEPSKPASTNFKQPPPPTKPQAEPVIPPEASKVPRPY